MLVFFRIAALSAALFSTHAALAEDLSTPRQSQISASYQSYECNLSGSAASNLSGCSSNPAGGVKVSSLAVKGDGSCQGSSPYCGARSGGTAVAPIDVWGLCRWIDNSSADAIFVPFKTSIEWQSFITAASPPHGLQGVALTHCAEPYGETGAAASISTLPPYANCAGKTLSDGTMSAPNLYGRTGVSLAPASPVAQNFSCHNGATDITSRLQWKAGDADITAKGQLSWTPNFIYSPDVILTANGQSPSLTIDQGTEVELSWSTNPGTGTSCQLDGFPGVQPPQGSLNVTPATTTLYTISCTGANGLTSAAYVTVNVLGSGVCGSDAGQSLASAPVNLCASSDTASVVTTTANGWSWTCAPAAGGTSAACSATLTAPQCGPANGSLFAAAPASKLCAEGTATGVTGPGPWYWSCQGASGTVKCSAQQNTDVSGNCGDPPTIITNSIDLPDANGRHIRFVGDGLAVTVEGGQRNCFEIVGSNNSFTLKDGVGDTFFNSVVTTGNANTLDISGFGSLSTTLGNQTSILLDGWNLYDVSTTSSGFKGMWQWTVNVTGDRTSISNPQETWQNKISITGDNTQIQTYAAFWQNATTVNGNNTIFQTVPLSEFWQNTTTLNGDNATIDIGINPSLGPGAFTAWQNDTYVSGNYAKANIHDQNSAIIFNSNYGLINVVSYGDNYAPGFNKPAFTYDHSYTGNNNKISITCILCSDDAITGNNNVITLRNNNYIWNSGSADYFSDNNLAITGHNNSITNNGTTTVTP